MRRKFAPLGTSQSLMLSEAWCYWQVWSRPSFPINPDPITSKLLFSSDQSRSVRWLLVPAGVLVIGDALANFEDGEHAAHVDVSEGPFCPAHDDGIPRAAHVLHVPPV